jgi:hypothetical protein
MKGRALAGLVTISFVFAMLLPMHHLPLPSFLREWLVAVVLLLASIYSLKGVRQLGLGLDLVAGVLALMAGAAILHGLTGISTIPSVLLYIGYLALAAISYYFGWQASLSSCRQDFVHCVASALMLGALYSCVPAAFQLSHFSLPFELVYPPTFHGVYGNLAQQNHFNNLLWLGLASTGVLHAQGAIRRSLAIPTTLVLVVFSVLSASRSGFLYAAAFAGLSFVFRYRSKSLPSSMGRFPVVISMTYATIFFLFTKFDVAGYFGFTGLADRVGGAVQAPMGDSRFAVWSTLLPYIDVWGAGVGNFKLETLRHPDIWLAAGLGDKGFEHSHNLILDVAIEYGAVIALLVLASVGLWLWRRRHAVLDLQAFWAASLLAIIGVYSMLEYPMYYTYFLIPFFLAAGFLAPLSTCRYMQTISNKMAAFILLFLSAVLVTGYNHFNTVDDVFFQFQFGRNNTQSDKYSAFSRLDEIPSYSPYKPYASIIRSMLANKEDVQNGLLEQDCANVERIWLSPMSLVNCAVTYELAHASAKAEQLMTGVCNMHAGDAKSLVEQFNSTVDRPVSDYVLGECRKIAMRPNLPIYP